ncbi:MAG: molecular chaperone GrpE [Verrucomicrobiales bacterium]|jgi:molecular chaperone GrpE
MSEQETEPAEDNIVDLEVEIPEPPEQAHAQADTEGENAAPVEPEISKDPLTVAKEELAQWRDTALRTKADLENFRKRSARDRTDAIKFGNTSLLEELVPIVDNFEMGLAAATANGAESSIAQGMGMVQKQLTDFLANNGLKEVETNGKEFNPNLHEALSQQASDEVPEGTIISTMRKGYQLHDRLLRAANVVVSSGPGGQ